MTIALWCVLVAALLPLVAIAPAKAAAGYDNNRPRDPAFWNEGFRARAAGAMANGFEAFPLFAVAVLVGLERGDQQTVDFLAMGFIAVRLGYLLAYWSDRATLRSAFWATGLALAVAIFLTPLWAPAAGP
jgi:uncharacterized MAPEG superfamily protein